MPCTRAPSGKGLALDCQPGEPEGTLHPVVATGGCQPFYVSADGAAQVLAQFLATPLRLYAVVREGDRLSVFFAGAPGAGAFIIEVEDGGIISFHGACGREPSEAVPPNADYVVPPQK